MSRPAVKIDPAELEKLAGLHCTEDEAARWFGVSQATISRRLRQKVYREAWERGQATGKVSLRRAQFRAAERGNATMLIWLGKQWLGQTDNVAGPDDEDAIDRWIRAMKGGKA